MCIWILVGGLIIDAYLLEASEIHGRLIHMFNRVSTDNNLSDPKGSLMSYLSNLESEFKNWLDPPWELI